MSLVSIDVGIKNLAVCVFALNSPATVMKWEVLQLIGPMPTLEPKNLCGSEKNKKREKCTKVAKYTKAGKFFCAQHGKTHPTYRLPVADLKTPFLKKQKLEGLKLIYANYLDASDLEKITKTQMLKELEAYKVKKVLETCSTTPITSTASASEVDLVTVGRALMHALDDFLARDLEGVVTVVIENQISPLASRMKTLQGMIAQYFIMRRGNAVDIKFVSATNKLKIPLPNTSSNTLTTDTITYSDRKKKGIENCRLLLSTHTSLQEWQSHFETHKKKDDLADAFLQGYHFLLK